MIGSFRLPISITSSGDTTAPTITTAIVEDANPDKLVVVFSEVVDITDTTGLTITGDTTPTLSAPIGTGSNTITLTLSTALTNGQSVTLNVASSNTIKDAATNALLATTQAITNNVAAVNIYEAETTSYMNAIATPNDGTATIYTGVTGGQLWTLVNDLVAGLKTNSLWAKLFYYYLFLGDTAILQKYNLKDINTFPLTWYGGWVYDNKGALGNGTNAYAKTGFTPSLAKELNSNGLSIVIGTNNTPVVTNAIEIGAFNASEKSSYLKVFISSSKAQLESGMNGGGPSSIVSNPDSKGVYTSVKQSSTLSKVFKNSIEKKSWNGGGTLPIVETYIGTLNTDDSAYGSGYSNQRFQGALEHTGLTLTEVQTLHSLIDTFEAAIGRKTW